MSVFTEQEQQKIQKAITLAEQNTSGEIRLCIEKQCKGDVLERAAAYFTKLGMDKTALRNGVLIYLATDDRRFAIVGDVGINRLVPEDFWNSTKEAMLQHFKNNNLVEGVLTGIQLAGEQLKGYFPSNDSDKNELSDDIAFMDNE